MMVDEPQHPLDLADAIEGEVAEAMDELQSRLCETCSEGQQVSESLERLQKAIDAIPRPYPDEDDFRDR